MNGYILKESMYNFINKIGAVSYEQIQLMYGNVYDKDTIKWSVKQLIAECLISKDSETDLITRRGNIDLSDFQQKQRTNAAWLLLLWVYRKSVNFGLLITLANFL